MRFFFFTARGDNIFPAIPDAVGFLYLTYVATILFAN